MTGRKLAASYYGINKVDDNKLNSLVESMLVNGFVGCPILTLGDTLLTGSHRLAALQQIVNNGYDAKVLDQDVSEDVTDIIESSMQAFEAENGYLPDLDYSNIGQWLKGSWVEQYKDEIEEW